jgi:multidrug efflux pump subunit AcrA (membrane-fusion protein)
LSAHSKLGGGVLAIVLVIASAAFIWNSRERKTVQAHQTRSNNVAEVAFASSGRVEGLSDTTQVGAAADGVLKAIYVKEDQFVTKGTLMGEIACDDLDAMLQTALAEADVTRQARVRLLRGARAEEKRIAAKKTAAAHATFAEARSRLSMQRALYKGGEISRAAYEQADRDFGVAKAARAANPRCVAILLTGYPDLDSETESIKKELDGYLVKPADIENLLKTIEQKLAARMRR